MNLKLFQKIEEEELIHNLLYKAKHKTNFKI